MATTSSTLVAGKVMPGRGNNGKGSKGRTAGLVATAALGLSLVVGGLLNQIGQPAPATEAPSINSFAGDTHVATMWDFREDRRIEVLGTFSPDQFTYREDRRSEIVPQFVADQFTYREDRRVGATAEFVPDQFTYREDRRSETVNIFSPDQFTYREDRREP